jgi:hypothetical protein
LRAALRKSLPKTAFWSAPLLSSQTAVQLQYVLEASQLNLRNSLWNTRRYTVKQLYWPALQAISSVSSVQDMKAIRRPSSPGMHSPSHVASPFVEPDIEAKLPSKRKWKSHGDPSLLVRAHTLSFIQVGGGTFLLLKKQGFCIVPSSISGLVCIFLMI